MVEPGQKFPFAFVVRNRAACGHAEYGPYLGTSRKMENCMFFMLPESAAFLCGRHGICVVHKAVIVFPNGQFRVADMWEEYAFMEYLVRFEQGLGFKAFYKIKLKSKIPAKTIANHPLIST